MIVHFTLGRVNPKSTNGINVLLTGLVKAQNNSNRKAYVLTVRTKQNRFKRIYQRDGFEVVGYKSIVGVIGHLWRNRRLIELIQIHNTWCNKNLCVAVCAKLLNLKFFVHPHASFFEDRMEAKKLFKKIYHLFLQGPIISKAEYIVASGIDEYERLEELLPKSRIALIENGMELPEVDLGDAELSRTPGRFGLMARFSREKNQLEAIKLIQFNGEITLRFIGDPQTPYGRKCLQYVEENELSDQVFFLGSMHGEQKLKEMLTWDVYVQSSRSEGGLSLAIREALLLGIPCLVSEGCRTKGFESLSGLIVYNEDNFLKKVEKSNEVDRRLIRREASQRFSWKIYVESIDKLLNRL